MNSLSRFSILVAASLALLLPSARTHSQVAAPLPEDPLAALQVLLKTNDDLLKRQDDSLKALTELTNSANEIRIYSRRG